MGNRNHRSIQKDGNCGPVNFGPIVVADDIQIADARTAVATFRALGGGRWSHF